MSLKEFLKPEWKKIILPVIFISIFIILIKFSYDTASLFDKYMCEMLSVAKQRQVYIEQNNTEALEEIEIQSENLSNNFRSEVEKNRLLKLADEEFFFHTFMSMKKINPLLPFPCEHNIMDLRYKHCRFYINEEAYNCFINFTSFENIIFGFNKEMIEYKKVSFFDISSNILILFIEGYLVSCLILFCYRKIIRKVKNEL